MSPDQARAQIREALVVLDARVVWELEEELGVMTFQEAVATGKYVSSDRGFDAQDRVIEAVRALVEQEAL